MHLHTGVVDDAIDCRKIRDQLADRFPDSSSISHIEHSVGDAGMSRTNLLQPILSSPGDDDPIASCMERLRQTAPNPGSASSDEYRIPAQFHLTDPSLDIVIPKAKPRNLLLA